MLISDSGAVGFSLKIPEKTYFLIFLFRQASCDNVSALTMRSVAAIIVLESVIGFSEAQEPHDF